ncbi:MAG: F0F1 ATP synthase subunit delta [Alphaproteobacteria bacterium]
MAAEGLGESQLAGRYAKALFELADEKQELDAVAGDLRTVQVLLDESADLRRAIRSPLIARDAQGRALAEVLSQAGVGTTVRNFVGVVANHRRLFALPDMIRAFLAELARRRGEETARVVSARPLGDAQASAVTESLKKAMGAKVAVDFTVDPALIGGLVVHVGSRMIDSSVRTRLQKLQQAMKGA